MPQRRQSRTIKLPDGSRVTITTGSTRRRFYKTVTVKRANGTTTSRTYRRGPFLSIFLGAYSTNVPSWAKPPQAPPVNRTKLESQRRAFAAEDARRTAEVEQRRRVDANQQQAKLEELARLRAEVQRRRQAQAEEDQRRMKEERVRQRAEAMQRWRAEADRQLTELKAEREKELQAAERVRRQRAEAEEARRRAEIIQRLGVDHLPSKSKARWRDGQWETP